MTVPNWRTTCICQSEGWYFTWPTSEQNL